MSGRTGSLVSAEHVVGRHTRLPRIDELCIHDALRSLPHAAAARMNTVRIKSESGYRGKNGCVTSRGEWGSGCMQRCCTSALNQMCDVSMGLITMKVHAYHLDQSCIIIVRANNPNTK